MFKFRDPSQDNPYPPNPRPDPGPFPDPIPNQNPDPQLGPDAIFALRETGYAIDRTPLQVNFMSSFFITSQVSMLGFLIVMVLFSKRFPPPPKRILGGLFSMLVLFLINMAFIRINTDTCEYSIVLKMYRVLIFRVQVEFFGITMVLVVLLSVSSAVTMVSLFELVTKFPLDYYAAILSGQALCGIISSSVRILTLSMNSYSLINATIFFGVGTILILFTSVFYLITKKKSKYFVYRVGQYEGNDVVKDKWAINFGKMKTALYRTKWIMGSMVFVQGSTAMIHPGFAALVVSEDKDSGLGGEWNETYFVPVITFFCFNLADFIGREAARKIKQPRNAVVILIVAALRIILVPLLMLCNAQPRNHMPVYFGDNFYIFLIILFGSTQGYLVSLCIISVPIQKYIGRVQSIDENYTANFLRVKPSMKA
ncbi:hypothetical protein NQ317_007082 [Molorchus minor]|uniref:Equilibrative nucleoside transporter n=1 Tax=Molorchus minor TaxID=1323400 RepID=A0ABQ9K6Y9_9CUCU|nr:hypothetical protein NQ317_007082 [Molorchus minor]